MKRMIAFGGLYCGPSFRETTIHGLEFRLFSPSHCYIEKFESGVLDSGSWVEGSWTQSSYDDHKMQRCVLAMTLRQDSQQSQQKES